MYIIASCFLVIIRSIIVDTDYESILIEYTLVMTFEAFVNDICTSTKAKLDVNLFSCE